MFFIYIKKENVAETVNKVLILWKSGLGLLDWWGHCPPKRVQVNAVVCLPELVQAFGLARFCLEAYLVLLLWTLLA